MRRLAQSTAYTVMLKLFLSSDHVSPATGKTVAIVISKAGGAFGNPNAGASNATEVSNGWYKFALDTTDTGTLGDLVVRGTSASCDDAEQVCQVVSATTGGATNLDAAISTRATPTNITAGTITTVTNLTNAPTAGDLTATMKASVTTAATAATPTIGAVASVTGNVGGNVVGSVGSVSATVSADIKKVNGVTVNGNGAGTPWGP